MTVISMCLKVLLLFSYSIYSCVFLYFALDSPPVMGFTEIHNVIFHAD